MNYNFTVGVRQSLARARDESVRLRHHFVGSEHILLGLLPDESIRAKLRALGVAPAEVKAAVEAKVPPGSAAPNPAELPYTARSKRVLELSMSAARGRNDSEVRPEHLLIALIREETGIAAEALSLLGVTEERIASAPAGGAAPGFRIRIDDASDRSIYEQIVSGVTEAVATGELRPGSRLPTVRQLADELDVAPGTVARAYSELERTGVVVTEGARGTRVAERDRSALSSLDRPGTLTGLLRPVAVAAFHLGASAAELRAALDEAMRGIFDKQDHAA
jgi:DNA-binding transcriptional regulator YhcF (GntR family)